MHVRVYDWESAETMTGYLEAKLNFAINKK